MTSMKNQGDAPVKKRIVWIDYARALAILSVILCHSTEAIYSLTVDGVAAMGIGSQVAAFAFFTIGRLGVPLFLFMSGYLMLDRFYDRDACVRFWKNKWIGLLVATEIWLVIYNVFLCYAGGAEFSFVGLIENMLFLERVPMGHMWYMPMIIGLYLFLPFMANGLKMLDDARVLIFPLSVGIALFFVMPVTNVLLAGFGLETHTTIIDAGYSGGVYGIYILLGYCVKKGLFARVPFAAAVMGGGTAFVAIVALQIFGFDHGAKAGVWYSSGLLLLAGLCLYLALSHIKAPRIPKAVEVLSYYSFALYLVHYPVKILVTPWIESIELPGRSFEVVFASIVILAISLVLCAIIARIPKVGAKVLYLR